MAIRTVISAWKDHLSLPNEWFHSVGTPQFTCIWKIANKGAKIMASQIIPSLLHSLGKTGSSFFLSVSAVSSWVKMIYLVTLKTITLTETEI